MGLPDLLIAAWFVNHLKPAKKELGRGEVVDFVVVVVGF